MIKLPPKISKQDLCVLLEVRRIRCVRKHLLTDDFINTKLKLDIETFNKRQQFSIEESLTIKNYLFEKFPGLFGERLNSP